MPDLGQQFTNLLLLSVGVEATGVRTPQADPFNPFPDVTEKDRQEYYINKEHKGYMLVNIRREYTNNQGGHVEIGWLPGGEDSYSIEEIETQVQAELGGMYGSDSAQGDFNSKYKKVREIYERKGSWSSALVATATATAHPFENAKVYADIYGDLVYVGDFTSKEKSINQIVKDLLSDIKFEKTLYFKDISSALKYRCTNHSIDEPNKILHINNTDTSIENPSTLYDIEKLPAGTEIYFNPTLRADSGSPIEFTAEGVIWELSGENQSKKSFPFSCNEKSWQGGLLYHKKEHDDSVIRLEIYWHDNNINPLIDLDKTYASFTKQF